MALCFEMVDVCSPFLADSLEKFVCLECNKTHCKTSETCMSTTKHRRVAPVSTLCNAHFLLGLGSEAEKMVKDITKGSKFGRNKVKAFGHFSNSSETWVSRYLCLARSSLGPCRDKQNG